MEPQISGRYRQVVVSSGLTYLEKTNLRYDEIY